MQSDNRFLDDLSKLATGAAGALNSAREEARANMRAWLDRQLSEMDLVTREEFEVVRDMAARAREENERLSECIDALEKTVKSQKTSGRSSRAKSTAKGAKAKSAATTRKTGGRSSGR